MYVNGKKYLLKLFWEWKEWRMKENGGGNEFKCNIFDTL
jgi:hypothetical protein